MCYIQHYSIRFHQRRHSQKPCALANKPVNSGMIISQSSPFFIFIFFHMALLLELLPNLFLNFLFLGFLLLWCVLRCIPTIDTPAAWSTLQTFFLTLASSSVTACLAFAPSCQVVNSSLYLLYIHWCVPYHLKLAIFSATSIISQP